MLGGIANKKKPKRVLRKKKAIRDMRQTSRVNPDGSRSSHLMSWAGDPSKKRGDFAVFPTIAPKKGKEDSSKASDWKDISYDEAKNRGEVIRVKSRKKASKLAAGSWKKKKDR